jgi:hypothetical protein
LQEGSAIPAVARRHERNIGSIFTSSNGAPMSSSMACGAMAALPGAK